MVLNNASKTLQYKVLGIRKTMFTNKILPTFIFVLFASILSAQTKDNHIAAVINDEIVTKFEIDTVVAPALIRMKEQYPPDVFIQKKREMWNIRLMQVIENKLLLQEARRKEVAINPREVERSFNALLKRAGGSITELDAILRKQGLSIRQQRKQIKEKMMIDRLLRQELEPAIYISPAHVRDYYMANKDTYQKKQRVEVQNILISTEDRPALEAQELAKKVYSEIKAGTSFDAAVEMYSEGQFKPQRGVVDFFDKGTYFPVFEKVCFSLEKVGDIPEPFKSPIGWHIVKLRAKEGGELTPMVEVGGSIKVKIHQKEYQKKVEAYITGLKKKSYIKFYTRRL